MAWSIIRVTNNSWAGKDQFINLFPWQVDTTRDHLDITPLSNHLSVYVHDAIISIITNQNLDARMSIIANHNISASIQTILRCLQPYERDPILMSQPYEREPILMSQPYECVLYINVTVFRGCIASSNWDYTYFSFFSVFHHFLQ